VLTGVANVRGEKNIYRANGPAQGVCNQSAQL
jgi:hypothetical protein